MTGGFVRTESVKAQIMRILSHVRLGIPVFLRGHLGVGKTETALHVSRAYLGFEPEFISGSEEATKYDIYGRTQIGIGSDEERLQEYARRMEEYRRLHPSASGAELSDVERSYYRAIVVQRQATSFFQYGPLVQAMRQGKPLIIDEMDGIPHSIFDAHQPCPYEKGGRPHQGAGKRRRGNSRRKGLLRACDRQREISPVQA